MEKEKPSLYIERVGLFCLSREQNMNVFKLLQRERDVKGRYNNGTWVRRDLEDDTDGDRRGEYINQVVILVG